MTIRLSTAQINQINDLMQKGFVIELRYKEGDLVEAENQQKVPRPPQILINKRPELDSYVDFQPILIDENAETVLGIYGYPASGGIGVLLQNAVVPAGFYLSGIKGYISQEMEQEQDDEGEKEDSPE